MCFTSILCFDDEWLQPPLQLHSCVVGNYSKITEFWKYLELNFQIVCSKNFYFALLSCSLFYSLSLFSSLCALSYTEYWKFPELQDKYKHTYDIMSTWVYFYVNWTFLKLLTKLYSSRLFIRFKYAFDFSCKFKNRFASKRFIKCDKTKGQRSE